ncbi:MAG TPA: inorganic phosphate transporter [Candidatus Cloacimonetes bacterium]|jgi:PiT family inorganic phosphate transporter|nr:inorganic phosphate transporter [Candidatus Cloacimonas sp.]HHZ15329.1 inorganic phosphate transporter [Candidatus Cloacimonadota bacterium]
MIFFYLLSGLFLGWSLGANATGNVFGAAVSTRMIRFKTAALIVSIFIFLGAVLEGSGPVGTLGRLGSVDALGGAFTVSLAAALSIFVIVRMGIPVSTSQTVVGAIIGWNFFAGKVMDFQSLITVFGSWIFAFVLAALIAFVLFFIFRASLNRSKIHLLVQDMLVRYALVIVGAFAAFSLGANNIANVVGVFVPVAPFKPLNIAGLFVVEPVTQLYIIGAFSVVVGVYTYSHRLVRTVGKDIFQLSPITALVVLLAQAIVLFLFASRGLHNLLVSLGLPTFPLVSISFTHLTVGAVMGIALAKGGKNVNYRVLGRISVSWIAAPVMAFLLSFVLLFVMQNVFELKVHEGLKYVFNRHTLAEISRNGYDTDALSTVNGRTFDREQAIFNELNAQQKYERDELIDIIRITQIYPMEVNTKLLTEKGLNKGFTRAQWSNLLELEGKKYRHKWQLEAALVSYEAWHLHESPENEQQKNHNRGINSKLELLYRSFYTPKKGNK